MSTPELEITSNTVGKLTTYQLRQELVRRNCLDIPEEKINHRSMLERLVRELVGEETQKAQERVQQLQTAEQDKLAEAKRLRELRKQEALERSRHRQADPEYFKKKQETNKVDEETKRELESKANNNDEGDKEEEPADNNNGEYDPFRRAPSGRAKIFIK